MGKNNSVKKIDEEQILKRFEYTVQEYIRFYDFYKNQEVSEENTEAFYVMLTTLIISKKPGNTGISRDIRTEFTTDLLLSD